MRKLFLLLLFTLSMVGCDLAQPKPGPAGAPPVHHIAAEQQQEAEPIQNEAGEANEALEENTVMVRAEAGVGARGSNMTPPSANNPIGRIIGAPVYSMFRTEQRIIFDMQVTPALNLFQAEHGRRPNSHNEFMERIIRANNIQLPALRPNEEYIYDPQRGELMVRRPG